MWPSFVFGGGKGKNEHNCDYQRNFLNFLFLIFYLPRISSFLKASSTSSAPTAFPLKSRFAILEMIEPNALSFTCEFM